MNLNPEVQVSCEMYKTQVYIYIYEKKLFIPRPVENVFSFKATFTKYISFILCGIIAHT